MLSYRLTEWLFSSVHRVRMCIRVADVRIYVIAQATVQGACHALMMSRDGRDRAMRLKINR
ncbi:MAG: hypothetical protein MUF82_05675 [Bacteroidetes bacterium]|jgi:hypothetical protein|nr:hypothetical protein [Bacteroidota bacterium]